MRWAAAVYCVLVLLAVQQQPAAASPAPRRSGTALSHSHVRRDDSLCDVTEIKSACTISGCTWYNWQDAGAQINVINNDYYLYQPLLIDHPPRAALQCTGSFAATLPATCSDDLKNRIRDCNVVLVADNTAATASVTATLIQTLQIMGLCLGRGWDAQSIVTALSRAAQLRVLDANRAGLTSITTWTSTPQLTSLSLFKNSLSTVPADFLNSFQQLKVFDMSYNPVASLPESLFSKNDQMQSIRFEQCGLTTLPSGLFTPCKSVKIINLSGNQFANLPQNLLAQLAEINTLDLSVNLLTTLPSGLFSQAVQLENLYLNNNQLQQAPAWGETTVGLRVLNLASNRFAGNLDLSAFKQLSTAILGSNNFNSVVLPSYAMEYVDVGSNPGMTSLQGAASIASLDISDTQLAVRQQSICVTLGFSILTARFLTSSQLVDLSPEQLLRQCLSRVDYLDVTGLQSLTLQDLQFLTTQVFAVSTLNHTDLHFFDQTTQRLQPLYRAPQLNLGTGSNIQCSSTLSSLLAFDANDQHFTIPGSRLSCQCAPDHSGNDCAPSFQVYKSVAIGLAVAFSVLAGGALIAGLIWYLRRRFTGMRKNLELHQLLLQDAETEMSQMRKVWEIEGASLNLKRRIDGSSLGAFGAVWAADWDGLAVAVKVLRTEMMQLDAGTVEEFSKEAEFLMRARHPNLVRFFGAGTMADGSPFLVLELVSRGSLKSLLRGSRLRRDSSTETRRNSASAGERSETLSPKMKLQLTMDIARGMDYIHSLAAMHRDLKTGNVLVTESWHAKIADFGSMKSFFLKQVGGRPDRLGERGSQVSDSAITLTNGVGTPLYMAPEVLRGEQYAKSADIWSFGVVIWELMEERAPDILAENDDTGRGPLLGRISALLERGARLPVSSAWPAWAQQVVNDCFDAKPDNRPTFAAILSLLGNV